MSPDIKLDRMVAKYIVLAQAASDGGKYIEEELWADVSDKTRSAWLEGYRAKDRYIMYAITRIVQKRVQSFRFFVQADEDKKNRYIVYFNFYVNGRRRQVSFHSFNKELKPFTKNGQRSCWKKQDDSRAYALALASELGGI